MGIDRTKIIAGPCQLTLGSFVLGITEGDIELDYGRGVQIVQAPQYPGALVVIQSGEDQEFHVRGVLLDCDSAEKMKKLCPEVTLAGETIKIGNVPGKDITDLAEQLTIHPIRDGAAVTNDWHVYKAINVERYKLAHGRLPKKAAFDFAAITDLTKSDGQYLADRGVTADSTPPTRTSTSPSDGQTAVAVSTNVVIVFSESMAKHTLVNDLGISPSVILVNRTTQALVACAASVSTTTNPGDTLTLNPDANLDATTWHDVYVTEAAQDLNGNSHAGSQTDFQTS